MLLAAVVTAVVVAAWFNGTVGHSERSRPELGLFMIAAGVFAVCGAVFAWRFFMSHRRARFLAMFLGRGGTRYLYAILGGGLAGAGAVLAFL
jgi:hypothetical protein